jgi:hypothetical protein
MGMIMAKKQKESVRLFRISKVEVELKKKFKTPVYHVTYMVNESVKYTEEFRKEGDANQFAAFINNLQTITYARRD